MQNVSCCQGGFAYVVQPPLAPHAVSVQPRFVRLGMSVTVSLQTEATKVARLPIAAEHEQIVEAAQMAMKAHRIIVCWCMGLTQHKNAVATMATKACHRGSSSTFFVIPFFLRPRALRAGVRVQV